jgi:hypothetical protein
MQQLWLQPRRIASPCVRSSVQCLPRRAVRAAARPGRNQQPEQLSPSKDAQEADEDEDEYAEWEEGEEYEEYDEFDEFDEDEEGELDAAAALQIAADVQSVPYTQVGPARHAAAPGQGCVGGAPAVLLPGHGPARCMGRDAAGAAAQASRRARALAVCAAGGLCGGGDRRACARREGGGQGDAHHR